MDSIYLLLFAGILMLAVNKYLALGLVWWEKNIIGFKDEINHWLYRIFIIIVGIILITVFILKI